MAKKFALLNAILLLLSACSPLFSEKDVTLAPPCCTALSPDPDAHICPDRGLTLFLPRVIPLKSLLFTIEHRGRSPAFERPFSDFMGFDNGSLKIGLGLRYSPLPNLDVGFRRANNVYEPWDTYEFDGRYQFLEETVQRLDGAVTAGFTWFYQDRAEDASGVYLAGLFGRSATERFYFSSGLFMHTSSTYLAKSDTADAATVALPLVLIFSLKSGLSLQGEMMIPVSGYTAGHPSYALGMKYATWRHSFSILFTTSPYTTFDGIVTGSNWWDKPVLGFLITRKFMGEE